MMTFGDVSRVLVSLIFPSSSLKTWIVEACDRLLPIIYAVDGDTSKSIRQVAPSSLFYMFSSIQVSSSSFWSKSTTIFPRNLCSALSIAPPSYVIASYIVLVMSNTKCTVSTLLGRIDSSFCGKKPRLIELECVLCSKPSIRFFISPLLMYRMGGCNAF